MLFECSRVRKIWIDVSDILNTNISWKEIVCGYPSCDISGKIKCYNFVIGLIAYIIFRENSLSKFDNSNYCNVDIKRQVVEKLKFYVEVAKKLKLGKLCIDYMNKVSLI